ncbi:hypothetical protein LMG31886_04650 [Xanthomonas hydrangeae]|nr:hypothetical protein LMG31886_04650 [Xanthomonas hydrangeae]CAD7722989.1 hypothetical protein LMG31886_04650 [Xanthomonas hydrangeae]CAD7727311.1 hypothetical protein LMG31885_10840 [Xanthomonas hydrangeae]CAD7727315.1 hypothetical protein LMG31885_10840 [Xanthomonas hydrangeae]
MNVATGASVVGLSYDVQGNLSNKNGQAYTFSQGNRLRSVVNKEWYAYDGYGRRVIACGSAACNYQLYSQLGQLLYTQDARKGINTDYIYLAGSVVALRARPAAGGAESVTYQHTDALGSPVATTNAAGQVIERTQYEPYGAAIGKTVDGVGYTGHAMDGGTELIYMQQRYYDPVIGRFLSSDSVTAYSNPVGAFNRYWYANNNPYKFLDPDGNEGKVAWLVKLTANSTRKLARITQEQAIRARRAEQNVIADRRQVASQIETASRGGRDGQLKHAAHELEDGSKGLPHYQTEGKRGHTFWGKVSVGALALAGTLDRVAEAAEYVPDAAPRPAEQSDVARWNNTMGTISEATALTMPGMEMGKDGGFQGYFRVEGRIDSKRLSERFDEKK